MITCGIIAWQHFSQAEALAQSRQLVTSVRLARIDLADGVLNLMLSGDPLSPFKREAGFALLDQSVQEFREAQETAKLKMSPKSGDTEALDVFASELAIFREQLSTYRDSDSAAQHSQMLPLLLSFHKLDQLALRMDDVIRQNMQALSDRQNREFTITLATAALLVAMMCMGAIQAKKSQKSSDRIAQNNRELARESEARRALAMEAAKAGTWELDLDTGETIWSDEVWSLYGLEKGTCKPSYESWLATVIPEDSDYMANALKEIAQQSDDVQLEWRVKNLSGGISWPHDSLPSPEG